MRWYFSRLVQSLVTRNTRQSLFFSILILSCFILFLWEFPSRSSSEISHTPFSLASCSSYCTLSHLPTLNHTVEDLQRIRASVKQELAKLEKERNEKVLQRFQLNNELTKLWEEWRQRKWAVEALKADLESLRRQQNQMIWQSQEALRTTQSLALSPLLPLDLDDYQANQSHASLTRQSEKILEGFHPLESHFQWNLCPLSTSITASVFLGNISNDLLEPSIFLIIPYLGSLKESTNSEFMTATVTWCISYILDCSSSMQLICRHHKLNCLFLCPSFSIDSLPTHYPVVKSYFLHSLFRPGYDIILPYLNNDFSSKMLHHIVPPVHYFQSTFHQKRPHLMKFCAKWPSNLAMNLVENEWIRRLLSWLSRVNKTDPNAYVISIYNTSTSEFSLKNVEMEWISCSSFPDNIAWLNDSDYCLVPPPLNSSILSTSHWQQTLIECLYAGSVPVILSISMWNPLPFFEVIPQWDRATLQWPLARIMELNILLQTLNVQELNEKRRQGRIILERYLHGPQSIAKTMNLLMTKRLHLPLKRIPDVTGHSVWSDGNEQQMKTYEVNSAAWTEADDYLGSSKDLTMSSEAWNSANTEHVFTGRQFSTLSIDSALLDRGGNPDPFHAYPFSPWTGPSARSEWLGTEAQLTESASKFRPINHSINGVGLEFSHSLGGNRPYEQFTVVFLGHSRLLVLMSSIELLKDLPYLHSVIVVWNGNQSEATSATWPKLHVPLHIIKGHNNSLNNRFLPFNLIQTEAVLSLDDDVHMRHDEIILAFRVWREHVDQIVGFPARFHHRSQDNQYWLYNANYTCQYSMILTGAAFLHKYYYYLYSYVMSPTIRNIVDEKRNCEDLVMNFLVSHIVRKPPLKVTLRWTFACPKCDDEKSFSLHQRENHYSDRDWCINELVRVYGYNPLLYSQYRADSVLYKTRIPSNKQKCFKYV